VTQAVWLQQVSSPRFAAFVDAPYAFDAAAFGLSAPEAQLMDPQQRLLLDSVCEALPAAAVGPKQLAGQLVGVFVGIAAPDYASIAQAHSNVGPYGATGAALPPCACTSKEVGSGRQSTARACSILSLRMMIRLRRLPWDAPCAASWVPWC